jgi:hypothetical protein
MRRADREGTGGTWLLGRHEALQFFSAIQQDISVCPDLFRVGASHVAVDGRGGRLYGKAGSGAGTPGPSGVRAVLSNIATIV